MSSKAIGVICAVGVLFGPSTVGAQGTIQGLSKLPCVTLAVNVENKISDLSEEPLQTGLFVRARARLPRLRLEGRCSNSLFFSVALAEVPGGGYHGCISLELIRAATVLESGESTGVAVWFFSASVGGARAMSAQQRVLEGLDGLLDRFGSLYYRAGNK